jgi:integrase
LLGLVNTGVRPSEGTALLPRHTHLDCEIPRIQITAEGRSVKSRRTERKIPLVGVSLEAFRAIPGGAPDYQNRTGLTADINDYLRDYDLVPTDKHTPCGLRHSFSDRLLIAGVDDRVKRDLMGHSLNGVEYGEGGGLKLRYEAASAIAL